MRHRILIKCWKAEQVLAKADRPRIFPYKRCVDKDLYNRVVLSNRTDALSSVTVTYGCRDRAAGTSRSFVALAAHMRGTATLPETTGTWRAVPALYLCCLSGNEEAHKGTEAAWLLGNGRSTMQAANEGGSSLLQTWGRLGSPLLFSVGPALIFVAVERPAACRPFCCVDC